MNSVFSVRWACYLAFAASALAALPIAEASRTFTAGRRRRRPPIIARGTFLDLCALVARRIIDHDNRHVSHIDIRSSSSRQVTCGGLHVAEILAGEYRFLTLDGAAT